MAEKITAEKEVKEFLDKLLKSDIGDAVKAIRKNLKVKFKLDDIYDEIAWGRGRIRVKYFDITIDDTIKELLVYYIKGKSLDQDREFNDYEINDNISYNNGGNN